MSQLFYFPPSILAFLAGMILTLLTSGLFLSASPNPPNQVQTWIHSLSLLTLTISFVWIILIYPSEKSLVLAEHFIWDPLTALLSLTLVGISIFVFVYARDLLQDALIGNDYYILCLLAIFGALVMLTAGSVVVFYLGLEILALPLYGLVALALRDTLQMEAAMKYILMGIVASILLLYGFCLLYSVEPHGSLQTLATHSNKVSSPLAQVGARLVLTAFLFKLGAMPFHFWVPDIYYSTSIAVGLFITTIPKFAAIGMGLRLFTSQLVQLSPDFQYLLLALGVISMIGGNLIALMQTHLRRLIAYSSIAHMGPILLGLALRDYSIILLYGTSYCFMIATLFGILAHLAKVGIVANTIEDLQGLSTRYPVAALLMLVIMSSMAGIPPSLGFFSKFGLLYNLVKQGCYTSAGITLAATTIGSYYYLNIIRCMYFKEASIQPPLPSTTNDLSSRLTLIFSGLILFSLGLFPGGLFNQLENNLTQAIITTPHHYK